MEIDKVKRELRSRIRAQFAAIPETEIKKQSAAITNSLLRLPEIVSANCVLIYVSHGKEVETHQIIRHLIALGKQVCVPNYDDSSKKYLASKLQDFDADLAKRKFGILEPRPESTNPVALENLEVFVIPGLAFDQKGNRLGRGQGYFDRLLIQTNGPKIGLSYNFQLIDEIPTSDKDISVDIILTNNAVIRCRP